MKHHISLDRLKSVLKYEPSTGLFRWKIKRLKSTIGAIAGSKDTRGHIRITIDGKTFAAHQLAWYLVTGKTAEKGIDHKNRIRSDNRFDNLRPAGQQENMYNSKLPKTNTSGFKGVSYSKNHRCWVGNIRCNKKLIWLGDFRTIGAAAVAVKKAREQMHKEFACHG